MRGFFSQWYVAELKTWWYYHATTKQFSIIIKYVCKNVCKNWRSGPGATVRISHVGTEQDKHVWIDSLVLFQPFKTFSLVDVWICDFQGRRRMEKYSKAEKSEADQRREKEFMWKILRLRLKMHEGKKKKRLSSTQNRLAIFITARFPRRCFVFFYQNSFEYITQTKNIWNRMAEETQEGGLVSPEQFTQ